MTVFVVIGGVGLAILVLTLVLGELFEGVFDALDGFFDGVDGLFDGLDLDIDTDIDVDGDGGSFLSGPVLGAFLGAFGLGGALLIQATGAPLWLGAVAGLANGIVVGWLALRVTRVFMDMPTDETPKVDDLLGKSGKVVLEIPADGYGQVTVRHAGQPMKLSARAQHAVPAGTQVFVTAVLSTSSVEVATESTVFGLDESTPSSGSPSPHQNERRT